MKKTFSFISVLVLAALACNISLPQTTATPPVVSTLSQSESQSGLPLTEADVPRINVEDAKLALDNGQAILVDVRGVEFYAESHAEGAISIPLMNIEADPANLSLEKNQWIITYCT